MNLSRSASPRTTFMLTTLLACWLSTAAAAQETLDATSATVRSGHMVLETSRTAADPNGSNSQTLEATYDPEASERQAGSVSPFRSRSDDASTTGRASNALPLTTVVSSLAIVLGLFGGLVWVFRRSGGTANSAISKDALQVIGRAPLAPRQNMVLVRCGQRILVLAVGGSNTCTLAEITHPDEVAELLAQCSGTGKQHFQQTLQSLGKEKPTTNRFVDDQDDSPRSLFASV